MLDMLNQRDSDRKAEKQREYSLPQSPAVVLPSPEQEFRKDREGLAKSISDLRFQIEMIAMEAGVREADVLKLLVNHFKRSSSH